MCKYCKSKRTKKVIDKDRDLIKNVCVSCGYIYGSYWNKYKDVI